MRELTYVRHGRLEWRDRPGPVLQEESDALVRTHLPDVLAFLETADFPAEKVSTLVAEWDDAPDVYRPTPPSWCCGASRSRRPVEPRTPLDE